MAKKRATKTKRKKGLNLDVLRRAAKARVKKLEDNIKKRDKAIARAKKFRDKEKSRATIEVHRQLQKNAKVMVKGLKGVIKMMNGDECPFMGQGDPLA